MSKSPEFKLLHLEKLLGETGRREGEFLTFHPSRKGLIGIILAVI